MDFSELLESCSSLSALILVRLGSGWPIDSTGSCSQDRSHEDRRRDHSTLNTPFERDRLTSTSSRRWAAFLKYAVAKRNAIF